MSILKRVKVNWLHHYVDGAHIQGANPEMTDYCNDLRGNCTGLWGYLDKITDEMRAENSDISFYAEQE